MTDPLALDPVLPPAERTPVAGPDGLDHDAWFEAFEAHVIGGGKVEADRRDARRVPDRRPALRRDARQLAS